MQKVPALRSVTGSKRGDFILVAFRGTRRDPRGPQACPLWFLEKLGQDVRTIGHDAIDPVAEQAAHVGLRVDGPHVDPQPTLVSCPDEFRRHHAQPVEGLRTLQCPVARSDEPAKAKAAQNVEEDQLGARGGRRHPSTRNRTETTNGGQILGDHKRALLGTRRLDNPPDGLLDARPLALYLDVYWHVVELVVDLFQGRNLYALIPAGESFSLVAGELVAGVQVLYLRERHLPYGSGALRGPVDDGVVDHDDVSVGGGVHVEFQHPGPDLEGLPESLQGILWCDPRPTAMREA